MNGLDKAQRQHDLQTPSDMERLYDADGEQELASNFRPAATDAEINEVIERIAETGLYDDAMGQPKRAGDVYIGIAVDWVDDRSKLPGHTYTAFLKWATAITTVAKYGIR